METEQGIPWWQMWASRDYYDYEKYGLFGTPHANEFYESLFTSLERDDNE